MATRIERMFDIFCSHDQAQEGPRNRRSADICRIFTDACDRAGIEWRQNYEWMISVSRRESAEKLNQFIGPKSSVPGAGLEPARPFGQQILSLRSLPIPPSGRSSFRQFT
jgi:hypothetical protein